MTKSPYIILILLFGGAIFLLTAYKGNQMPMLVVKDMERRDTTIYKNSNFTYAISDTVDLNGCNLVLPDSITLKFVGGIVMNGSITGSNTRLIGNKNLFDNIDIKGSWLVPDISTEMFVDLTKPNSIKNVFALSDARIENRIKICSGEYWVVADKRHEDILQIPSNTDVIINGVIKLHPNDLTSYSIISLQKAENVSIHGKGVVVGDKNSHLGKDGEWGMCILLKEVDNISIKDIRIRDAWGDCIYVGYGSKSVTIKNCILDNGRRQGISVIAGTKVNVEDCIISNVYGTLPEAAIDVEPNAGDTVSYVKIQNVDVRDCQYGFHIYSGIGNSSHIGRVDYSSCRISTRGGDPMVFYNVDTVNVSRCSFIKGGNTAINSHNVRFLNLSKNEIKCGITYHKIQGNTKLKDN